MDLLKLLKPKRKAAELPLSPAYSLFGWLNVIKPHARLTTKEEQLASYGGWVYAAVRRITEDLRAIRWRFVDADGKTIKPARLQTVFDRPFLLYTFPDLIERFWVHHDLTGEAFLLTITNGRGELIGLQPVSPVAVQEPVIEGGVFKGWRVTVNAQQRIIPPRDLIRSHYQHPLNEFLAASPVEAFAASYELDLYARAYGAEMVKNKSGIPAGIISTDQVIPRELAEQMREEWRQRHAERYGEEGPAILGAGATYQRVGIPLSDLRFLELAQVSRDQILGIYGVPASKLGLVEDVNRANADANDKTYRANVLAPRVRRFENVMNMYVLAEFFPQLYRAGIRLQFDDPVGVDPQLRFQQLLHGLRTGAVTRNEYRLAAGLEPFPNDALLMPLGVSEEPVEVEKRALTEPKKRELRHTDKDLELAALRFARVQEPAERKMKSQLRQLFSREQKEVLKAVKAWGEKYAKRDAEDDGPLNEFIEWIKRILEKFTPEWSTSFYDILFDSARQGFNQAFEEGSPVDWELMEPATREWIRRHAGQRIVDIQDTTLETLRNVLEQGLQEGWSTQQYASAIGDVYNRWKGYRAERIARTETGTAVNYGKWIHAQEMERITGRKVYKVWSAILDERTRPDHVAAHGQRKPLNEPYEVGGWALMHPLDPNGPASEVINCRCTEYYEVEYE